MYPRQDAALDVEKFPEIVCLGGHWIYTRAPGARGYPRWWKRDGDRGRPASVVVWEVFNGPLAEGMQLDHLCRVIVCVNPGHLEPVTMVENLRRRDEANGWRRAA